MDKKLLIIGLDCMTPQLVEEWKDDLPTLSTLMDGGTYRPLFSTIPPITVPAWMAMMTSKDGGQLGMYGFRNRKDYGYEALYTVNSNNVKEKTLWNLLSQNRKSSLIWGVPLTYPAKALNGMMVCSFLTPDKSTQWTYPAEVAPEIRTALVCGCIGEGPGIEFLGWLAELDLPDPEAVLADPNGFQLPERGDRAYAVLMSVAAAVASQATPERWAAGWQVLGRAGERVPDVAAMAARSLVRCRPDGAATPPEAAVFLPLLRDAGLA